jgi:hypothetical protein
VLYRVSGARSPRVSVFFRWVCLADPGPLQAWPHVSAAVQYYRGSASCLAFVAIWVDFSFLKAIWTDFFKNQYEQSLHQRSRETLLPCSQTKNTWRIELVKESSTAHQLPQEADPQRHSLGRWKEAFKNEFSLVIHRANSKTKPLLSDWMSNFSWDIFFIFSLAILLLFKLKKSKKGPSLLIC